MYGGMAGIQGLCTLPNSRASFGVWPKRLEFLRITIMGYKLLTS